MSSDPKAEEFLEQLRRILPKSESWEAWLERTGEFPPDFDSLPSFPDPPDPLLRYENDKLIPITTLEEWIEYRKELKALFHQWILGSVPPPPENLQIQVLNERSEGNVLLREVELTFGPGYQARLWLEQ